MHDSRPGSARSAPSPRAEVRRPAKRHALATRLWHWINALALIILFMSGLNISNAHRRLYWGDWGYAVEQAWLEVPRRPRLRRDPVRDGLF